MRDDGRQSGDEERNDMTVIGQARYWAQILRTVGYWGNGNPTLDLIMPGFSQPTTDKTSFWS